MNANREKLVTGKLEPFKGKTIEELEVIRKAKMSKIERDIAYVEMLDREVERLRGSFD